MSKPMPDGYHSLTPSFTFKDTQKAIDFYAKAFGAMALDVLPNPSGRGVMHATMRIGNSVIMMGDEMPGPNGSQSAETLGKSPISFYLYVPDADAAFERAVKAGCTAAMPVANMFWGDRAGSLKDPFGYSWMVATLQKKMTPQEITQGAAAFFAQFEKK